MSKHYLKHKAFTDDTHSSFRDSDHLQSNTSFPTENMLPILEKQTSKISSEQQHSRNYQNIHPLLAWYKSDLDPDNERAMYDLLTQIGLLPSSRQCQFCGNNMRIACEKSLFWLCTRRVNGIKCNRGKKSMREGTVFDGAMLSTQTILTILWHFVHQLTEAQCSQYTKISDKNYSSIVKWYKFACTVCTEWINNPDNMPKIGGYGKIVEFDESFFPGKPKYNRGRRLGETG